MRGTPPTIRPISRRYASAWGGIRTLFGACNNLLNKVLGRMHSLRRWVHRFQMRVAIDRDWSGLRSLCRTRRVKFSTQQSFHHRELLGCVKRIPEKDRGGGIARSMCGHLRIIGAKQNVSPAVWRPRRDSFKEALEGSLLLFDPERHSMRLGRKRKSFLLGCQ